MYSECMWVNERGKWLWEREEARERHEGKRERGVGQRVRAQLITRDSHISHHLCRSLEREAVRERFMRES